MLNLRWTLNRTIILKMVMKNFVLLIVGIDLHLTKVVANEAICALFQGASGKYDCQLLLGEGKREWAGEEEKEVEEESRKRITVTNGFALRTTPPSSSRAFTLV